MRSVEPIRIVRVFALISEVFIRSDVIMLTVDTASVNGASFGVATCIADAGCTECTDVVFPCAAAAAVTLNPWIGLQSGTR